MLISKGMTRRYSTDLGHLSFGRVLPNGYVLEQECPFGESSNPPGRTGRG